MTPQELEGTLHQFIGTTAYYPMYPHLSLTDGTKFLCEQARCYWLMHIIQSFQALPQVRCEPFQLYELNVSNGEGLLHCTEGDDNLIHQQRIASTDFPLRHIKLYFIDGIVLLPTEY